jgi:uncharacterized membrane protein
MKKEEDYIVGILAYLTIVGFIVGLILNNDKKGELKKFGAFHLRQALGLHLGSIILYFAYALISTLFLSLGVFFAFIANLLLSIIMIVILVFIVLGVLNAINGQEKPLPFIGEYINNTFKNTFE